MRWNKSGHAALWSYRRHAVRSFGSALHAVESHPNSFDDCVLCWLWLFRSSPTVVWELEQYEGWLYPANDPDPPCSTRFPVPEGATALYLGNSRLVAGADVTMWSVLVPQDR